MFAKTIIDSDAFLDMPLSAQALYFHLSMRADDEGFVNNPKRIQRVVGASDDDLRLLILKRFILAFESGVIVIKHWRIHNYIRNDRAKETLYQKEKNTLMLTKNNAYTEKKSIGLPDDYQTTPAREQNDGARDTQVSIDKVSVDKDSIYINGATYETPESEKTKRFIIPTLEEIKAYCEERGNNVDAERFHAYYSSNGWRVGKNKMKDFRAAVRLWERTETEKPKRKNPAHESTLDFELDEFFEKPER